MVESNQSTIALKLIWYMRRTLEQLGFPGVVGLGLLVFCAAFYFSALVPLKQEVHSLRAMQAVAQAEQHQKLISVRQQPAGQLDSFYKSFPDVKDAPDALSRLHDAAVLQGVTLAQGEYRFVHNDSDKLVRYEIALPIKGDYVQLRKFLTRVLVDMPYVSLDEVAFQRQKISDVILDAQVKMTLFLLES